MTERRPGRDENGIPLPGRHHASDEGEDHASDEGEDHADRWLRRGPSDHGHDEHGHDDGHDDHDPFFDDHHEDDDLHGREDHVEEHGHDEHGYLSRFEGAEEHHEGPRGARGCLTGMLGLLAAVLVVGFVLSQIGFTLPGSDRGTDWSGDGEGTAVVTVRQGDTGGAIGHTLEQEGVVKSSSHFAQVFAGTKGADAVQPGSYRLRKHMSSQSAAELLLDPKSRTSSGVTIPEGLWASEIYALLSKKTGTPVADYKNVDADSLGLPQGAKGVEGYLFPSTYDFPEKASAQQQLKTMVDRFKSKTADAGIPASKMNETVTLASLVQGEGRGKDMPKVARVLENRLNPSNGETAGRLQLDSTVNYLLKKRGQVYTSDRDRTNSSPYNTYQHQGLPPGPINNPGLDALEAAEHPASGDWLYFVTVNQRTGETLFAKTYGEHQKNVQKGQACSRNPESC